jgi:plasmid stability protein
MEEEARDILRSALSTEPVRPRDLGSAIHERFAALGGVDLPETRREPSRAPPDFEA